MKIIDGTTNAITMRARDPIIAISGAPDSDLFYTATELVGKNRTLAKPFRRHRLLELVNEAIAPIRSQLACPAAVPG